MSFLTKDNRISVKKFAAVPALAGLPAIMRSAPSVSGVSSCPGPKDSDVDLKEGCMVTKVIKYSHRLVQFVNAVRGEDPSVVKEIIDDLAITPHEEFTLNNPCNLAFLEPSIHASLGLYAFIAITPSASTLEELIQMVQSDNGDRQRDINCGDLTWRTLCFTSPCFDNPQYELVALHPEHFLPNGFPLTVYDHETGTYKNYVAARDRCLRETVDPSSHRLPPFRHRAVSREGSSKPNVFLVALNAEIRFRRYLKMVEATPPPTPLPDHVLSLIDRTIELVRLIYWQATPTKGSKGERVLAQRKLAGEKEPPSNRRRARKFQWPDDWDLEARMAYGRALMSGHDLDYDPAFETVTDTYSNQANVMEWQQSVNPEAPEN